MFIYYQSTQRTSVTIYIKRQRNACRHPTLVRSLHVNDNDVCYRICQPSYLYNHLFTDYNNAVKCNRLPGRANPQSACSANAQIATLRQNVQHCCLGRYVFFINFFVSPSNKLIETGTLVQYHLFRLFIFASLKNATRREAEQKAAASVVNWLQLYGLGLFGETIDNTVVFDASYAAFLETSANFATLLPLLDDLIHHPDLHHNMLKHQYCRPERRLTLPQWATLSELADLRTTLYTKVWRHQKFDPAFSSFLEKLAQVIDACDYAVVVKTL